MPLNETLLDLICYVLDEKKFLFSREHLLGKEPCDLDVYGKAREDFFGLPEEIFTKAGIKCCVGNFDTIYDLSMSKASADMVAMWKNAQIKELSQFQIGLEPKS